MSVGKLDLETIVTYAPVGMAGLENDMNWLHLVAMKCYRELSGFRDKFSGEGRHKKRVAVQEIQRDIKESFFPESQGDIYGNIIAAIANGVRHLEVCKRA